MESKEQVKQQADCVPEQKDKTAAGNENECDEKVYDSVLRLLKRSGKEKQASSLVQAALVLLLLAGFRQHTQAQVAGANPSFSVIFGSDAQYPRALTPADTESANLPLVSRPNNTNHVASMNKLIATYGSNVKGVILNGDLTEYGHGEELTVFKSMYGELKAPLYPGLGNHDFSNNVNNCSENNCANRMVDYLQDAVKNIPNQGFDYKESNGYTFPDVVTTYSGSLAYSFDINNVHFVQLNNYPTYARTWSSYASGSAKRKTYNITSAMDWLKNDLATARNAGKVIVVNFHDPGEHWGDYGAKAATVRTDLVKVLTDYKVSAVFVGHLHSYIGRNTDSRYALGSIPVFFCGSSIYHRYLFVQFSDTTMTVKAINSENGDTTTYSADPARYALYAGKPATPLPNPPPPGFVTFFNQGGFVAKFSLSYAADGKTVSFDTGDMALGNKKRYDIPASATDVHITGQIKTGLAWKPWKSLFDLKFAAPPNKCYKAYNTTTSPKYNNNCE